MGSDGKWGHNRLKLCTSVFPDFIMSLKKTDLAKNLGLKISQSMKKAGVPGRFAQAASQTLDRKERRKLEQAEGLVPFAVKLHDDLVSTLRQLAEQEGGNLNALTERLLRAGLASGGQAVAVEKAAAKPAAKKAAAKKAASPAPAVKKAVAEKVAVKKAPAEKTPAKKVAATKPVAKKAAVKKSSK